MVCLCTFLYFPNFYSKHASLTSIYNEEMFCFKKERKSLRSRISKQREILPGGLIKGKLDQEARRGNNKIHLRGCTYSKVKVGLKGSSRSDTKQGLLKQWTS